MKNNHKKAALREKLKSNFEWTTEAIEDFNINGLSVSVVKPLSPVNSRILPTPDFMVKNEPKKDTMEDKIERVLIRKKEADERAIKKSRKLSHSSTLNQSLQDYQNLMEVNGNTLKSFEIADKLNNYFQDLLLEKQIVKEATIKSDSILPLHFFDDSTYDEVLIQPDILINDSNVGNVKAPSHDQIKYAIENENENENENKVVVNAVCLLSKEQLLELKRKTFSIMKKIKLNSRRSSNYENKNNNKNENDYENEKIRNLSIGKWFSCEVLHFIKNKVEEENNSSENDSNSNDEKDYNEKSDYDHILKTFRMKKMKEEKLKNEEGMKKEKKLARMVAIKIRLTEFEMEYENENENEINDENDYRKEHENNSNLKDEKKNYDSEENVFTFVVNPMQVFFPGQSFKFYGDRITDAVTLRRKCTALNKYYFYVRSMPYDNLIGSSLGQNQIATIKAKCMR